MLHSRTIILCAALALAPIGGLSAAEPAHDVHSRSLLKLELGTRIEQRCDERAGSEVASHHAGFKPDKVIAYALSDPEKHGTEIIARGALVRDHGHWYRLFFRCKTSSDGLRIISFEHELGPELPGWDMSELYHGD
ncbi:DUF930 domain-containing protein [Xanthobacter sp. TB0136]|uniref:DUF930 domain-containing protein n=1 Tax=Xanthobacter sp. TB0136 TaxID=3459177 RepID=UPI004039F073